VVRPTGFAPITAEGDTIRTPDDVEREMKAAIAFHLDGLKAESMAIPQRSTSSSYVEIPT
jgi:predicted RNase H-like HicB family nuclease